MPMDIQQCAQELGLGLDLFSCIQCGKCTGGCPVSITTALNVRSLVYGALVGDINGPLHREELWDCTSCFTCVERCPKDVRPAEVIIALRSLLVEEGKVPSTIGAALMGIFRQGNPLGYARDDRTAWMNTLEVKPAQEGCETLLFTCCSSAYDMRAQAATKSLVRILRAAGVDFGHQGTKETCCGNEVRRLGEMGLFEMLVEEGKPLLEGTGAHQMVTTSPHCMNTFHHEYKLGMEVLHYTQLLVRLLAEGKLNLTGRVEKAVTYHDPCFLGKQNGIFDEPREVIRAVPAVKLVEMDRSRERSLCCGGGGGGMWFEGTNPEVRPALQRVQEAADTGAEILLVACPFCMAMLEDAVKVKGLSEQLKVMDIAELVAMAL